jgi:hypothetical protein
MWGEDGIVVSVIVATVVMGIALLAGFVLLDGIAMWAVVALVIGAWLAMIGLLAKRYESGRWPFGKADPWQGQ